MWELDCEEGWAPKNWCFWTVVLEKNLRVPWTARRPSQSFLKEISPGICLEGLMLKLQLQYFVHLMRRVDSLEKSLTLFPLFPHVFYILVQFSCSVISNSLRPHESQHARPPCPSPSPGVHSDSRPSSQWCHPAISSSVIPFFLLPPIPPSIRVFSNESTLRMRWPKYWSFSFSIIHSKEIPGLISFRMDWLDLL